MTIFLSLAIHIVCLSSDPDILFLCLGEHMRVAFLTFEFPPTHGGGLSTYMTHTLKMLRTKGDQAFVLVIDNSVQKQKIEKFEGHDIIRINVNAHPICKTMGYWAAASYVIAEALAEAIPVFGMPDVVESCDGFGLAYYTLQRKHTLERPFLDLKVIVTAHTPCSLIDKWTGKSWYVLPRYWTRESEMFCLKAADMVLAPSQFIIDQLRTDFDCTDVQFKLVHNPYQSSGCKAENGLKNIESSKAPYYVFGSRIAMWKGALDIVNAFDRYWSNGGVAQLKMFGSDTTDAPDNGSLKEFIIRKYQKHVEAGRLHLLGLASPEELARQKRSALALLHPSHKENFPYTVIEHMAEGGLVIASENGGQAELIEHGKSGYLFPAKNIEAIVECLHQCDSMNEAKREEIGKAAKSVVEEKCGYDGVYASRQLALNEINPVRERFPFIRGNEKVFSICNAINSPRLSVVIPYFQLPDFITETVDSALASTLKDIEVIIVDDGSADTRSPEVLAVLEARSQVRVLRQENAGVAAARNFGVANARANYVALLDADDLVMPTYYERCVALLDLYDNVGFVGSWNDDFDEQGTIRHWPTFNPEPPMQLIFNTTNCQGLVTRKEAYNIGGGHDSGLKMFLDDWEAVISMLANGVRGIMIPAPLFRYRIRQGSIFRSKADQWLINYEYIISKHKKFYLEYAEEIICFLNANGPNLNYHNPTWPSSSASASMTTDEFSRGRLAKLLRGYYVFQRDTNVGRKIRRALNVFSPLLDWAVSYAYKIRRKRSL
jgi:glycosyltransferase involved in cell wall biosynthesis